jgi:hypothetical protein
MVSKGWVRSPVLSGCEVAHTVTFTWGMAPDASSPAVTNGCGAVTAAASTTTLWSQVAQLLRGIGQRLSLPETSLNATVVSCRDSSGDVTVPLLADSEPSTSGGSTSSGPILSMTLPILVVNVPGTSVVTLREQVWL